MRAPILARIALSPGGRGPRNFQESLPAPSGGWDADNPLAAMKPDRASLLDNWFPSAAGAEIRRGFWRHSATGVGSTVETLMTYRPALADSERLYAACGDGIYDVTSRGLTPPKVVSGLLNARWQHINFSNEGNQFLWACNGADAPRYFDGSTWSTANITGPDPKTIVHVAAHKKRLWFVLRNSLNAAYLPVNAVQGAASVFPLAGIFTRGGSLVAIGSWSTDAGADGIDDLLVFLSSQGQAAIYQGTNPADASDWTLVGVWDFSPPIGRRCILRVANDLALITQEGIVPISRAVKTERAALSSVALTKNIRNAMSAHGRLYGRNFGWQLISYPTGNMAILNVPLAEGSTSHQFVMNTLTGAWCRFTGQNAACWANYGNGIYFGGPGGIVYQADVADADYGQDLIADLRGAFSAMRRPGLEKIFHLLKPIYTTDGALSPLVGIDTDYRLTSGLEGAAGVTLDIVATWDTTNWDEANWGEDMATSAEWVGISGVGEVAAIRVRVIIKGKTGDAFGPASTFQMNGFSIAFEAGSGL